MKELNLVRIQVIAIIAAIAAMFSFELNVCGTVYTVAFVVAVVNYPVAADTTTVSAPMPGKVLSVSVKTVDAVKADHVILQASEPVEYAGLGKGEDPRLEEWHELEVRRQQALFGFWY